MLAADSLEKYGLNARIQVMDGDKLNDTLTIRQTLRKPGMDKMDLIIGPMYANSFSIAARFAKKHEIGIINPLSKRENIVGGNPFVIKTQVSGSGIAAKLSSFICTHYPNANIIVVRNDTKELKSLADDFESRIRSNLTNRTFKGSLLGATYATDMMAGVTKKLKPNVKNIIIFFSNSKTNVPNFVSLLNPLSKLNDILLIGMDGWDELELETEFLINLNYHQVTSSYIDYESEAVQQFITRFRNKYGAVPLSTKHAYLGYDIGWYFLTSIMWYGDKYISYLPDQKGNGLQYNFNFSDTKQGDGLQNQDVTIVKLVDYKMVKAE
jgi:ABC-type branched-subunit amino acid transport system substrate-binding protein